MSEIIDSLSTLYRRWAGVPPDSVELLPGAGSNRKYYRLSSPDVSAVGVAADNEEEALAFLNLSRVFLDNGVAVPEIYGSDGAVRYLQEDLGSVDLLSLIQKGEDGELPEETVINLARMQVLPRNIWENLVAFPPFSSRLVRWDLNYFKYEFLKPSGVDFNEDLLEDDFERFSAILCNVSDDLCGFMWRDCQSRNVMIHNGRPYFIDYQGGRMGPGIYDAVSFIWQAKAKFPQSRKDSLMDIYIREFSGLRNVDEDSLRNLVPYFIVFRLLQVLGAYGFRGLVEHKAHFVQSIPFALDNVSSVLDRGWFDEFPELKRICRKLCSLDRFRVGPTDGRLHVKVFSFSYKKGYPEDLTGNGGGFMFDCRGMHNPGRYDEYKPLTGLDREVADFLEEKGEIQPFVDNAYAMVSPAVATYRRRGFSSLQIGFGCTGGRHRSVYSAQHLAERLARDYPDVIIDLCHREQNIRKSFNS